MEIKSFKMKKNIWTLLVLPLLLNAQIKTDTLFSGKKLYVDFSKSITEKINKKIKVDELCRREEKIDSIYKHLQLQDEGYPSAQIPYLLKNYSKKSKTNILQNYNALIYTSYFNSNGFMSDIYLLEFFFENENEAKLCEVAIKRLIDLRHEDQKKDKEILLGTYNWFYLSKGNRLYLIHSMSIDNENCKLVKKLSIELLEILSFE